MTHLRSNVAVALALLALAAFGVMLAAPWFENGAEWWFSPRLGYSLELTPIIFVLGFVAFVVADGSDRAAALATRLSVSAALATVAYWIVGPLLLD